MNRLVSRHANCRSARPLDSQKSICIVDPRPQDYLAWQATAAAHGLQLTFLTTAEEALRHSRTQAIDLWVVNTELAGLSGYELCGMLKSRSTHTAVYLVAEEHSPDAERAAWASRATVYCCKPAHVELLDQWRQCRGKPIRPPFMRHADSLNQAT